MNTGPDIAKLASLIADPVRAMMLAALMDGRALTAGELATIGGITPQTASAHLAKLVEGHFLAVTKQGRHRYFKLANESVADLLENMMSLSASQMTSKMPVTGPRNAAMRRARICYDHLAGEMGVALFDGLAANGIVQIGPSGENPTLTDQGQAQLTQFGINVDALQSAKRPICRTCLDWSMRKPHLAGGLGAALWQIMMEKNWAYRIEGSRAVEFTPNGLRQFNAFIRV